MGMNEVIRLEVDGMRHQILHHLGLHSEQISREVDAEITRFLATYDFAGAVRTSMKAALDAAIGDALKSYFSYGVGRTTINREVARILGEGETP